MVYRKYNELQLIEAAAEECQQAKVSVLLIPGIGIKEDLQEAVKVGAKMVRVATHVTEADVAAQHICTWTRAWIKNSWLFNDGTYGICRKNR